MSAAVPKLTRSVAEDGLLTISEAAAFLGVRLSNLYTIMEQGDLAFCKIGGAWRVPRRAVVALAERCLVGVYGVVPQ
jgi:excisionase family DNA binding protein